jgi:membrane-associated phospholipid phosphatase
VNLRAGLFFALSSLTAFAAAQYHLSNSQAEWWSNQGYAGTVGLGLIAPLLFDKEEGKDHALRVAEVSIGTAGLTYGLKRAFPETRPYGSDRESFPSGTAALTFAVAHMNAHWRPKQALLWYGAATICSLSRLQLQKHHEKDVVVGAALGVAVAELNLRSTHGWVLAPLVSENGTGLLLSSKF